jgi:3-dehydroquinate dehydratase
MRLSDLERPFICTSLAETTVEETVAAMKRAEYEGTRAFEVHLPLLDFPTGADAERLLSATANPVYATCRRDTFYELLGVDEPVSLTDGERAERLVTAVEAGFAGADFELDSFDRTPGPERFTEDAIAAHAAAPDATPAEVTDDPDAVARQEAFVADVHDAGGDVVLSAHTYTHLEPADAVAIAERMTERGADFGKLVGVDQSMDDALDTLEAHLRLNEADVLPYALMAIGDTSRITRPMAPMFGSAWVFAQHDLSPGGFHSWPLVENAREVLRRVDWRSAHDPHDHGRPR